MRRPPPSTMVSVNTAGVLASPACGDACSGDDPRLNPAAVVAIYSTAETFWRFAQAPHAGRLGGTLRVTHQIPTPRTTRRSAQSAAFIYETVRLSPRAREHADRWHHPPGSSSSDAQVLLRPTPWPVRGALEGTLRPPATCHWSAGVRSRRLGGGPRYRGGRARRRSDGLCSKEDGVPWGVPGTEFRGAHPFC